MCEVIPSRQRKQGIPRSVPAEKFRCLGRCARILVTPSNRRWPSFEQRSWLYKHRRLVLISPLSTACKNYPELLKFTRIICHIIGHNTYAEFWYWILYTNFQNFGKLYRICTLRVQNSVTCPVKVHSTHNTYANSVCRYSTLDSVQNSGRAREFWTTLIQNSVDLTVGH